MRNVLYLSYGHGSHSREKVFSILSLWHRLGRTQQKYRILVYTDSPEVVANLGVTIEHVSPRQLDEWSGPHGFKHRRKILALMHALRKYPAPTAMLDTDTYFTKSADVLFERIGPGRSLLHAKEGSLTELPEEGSRTLAAFLAREQFMDRSGRPLAIPSDFTMWNSGVIGLDPVDAPLLDEVLLLTDAIYGRMPLDTIEQFALGYFLQSRTSLKQARDVVFHYWMDYLREPFGETLPGLLARSEDQPTRARARELYRHRPRPNWVRRRKLTVKKILRSLGLLRTPEIESNG